MLEGRELDSHPVAAAGSRRGSWAVGVPARMRVCAHMCECAGLCVCGWKVEWVELEQREQ